MRLKALARHRFFETAVCNLRPKTIAAWRDERLAEKLTNILELSSVTGHKDLRMLKRYYHPRPEDLARKLAR